jgi:hypothetical protein
MTFRSGQPVIYMRTRRGAEPASDIPATYVEEVQFSHKERRHKVLIDGVNRFVGLHALRDAQEARG